VLDRPSTTTIEVAREGKPALYSSRLKLSSGALRKWECSAVEDRSANRSIPNAGTGQSWRMRSNSAQPTPFRDGGRTKLLTHAHTHTPSVAEMMSGMITERV
jgi:hypothetical protein